MFAGGIIDDLPDQLKKNGITHKWLTDMGRMTRMTRMTRMARIVACWLADLVDPISCNGFLKFTYRCTFPLF